jgi:hypothetical protein
MSSSLAVGQLNPLFGRKYQLQILQPSSQPPAVGIGPPSQQPTPLMTISDSDWEPEALRFTFDIQMQAFQSQWEATICVYNADIVANALLDKLTKSVSQNLLVSVSAGYQNGNYAVIWQGPIFQCFLERENVVDLKLTIYSILRLPPLSDIGDTGFSFEAMQTQRDLVAKIAQTATVPVVNLSDNISDTPLPRSMTLFGNMSQYLSNVANGNNMQWWLDANGLNFGSVDDNLVFDPNPQFQYAPPISSGGVGPLPSLPDGTGSIIGTPQETMYAVSFTVLLDPRLKVSLPLISVQINNTQLQYYKIQVGQPVLPLDQNGLYAVWALRFIGDTRENPWYTQIEGAKQIGRSLGLYQLASMSINQGSVSR